MGLYGNKNDIKVNVRKTSQAPLSLAQGEKYSNIEKQFRMKQLRIYLLESSF